MSWTAISDLDLAYYQIRFSDKTDGTGEWLNSVNLVTKVSRPATSVTVPARAGTYLIKAVDKLGNFSSNATAIISNVTSAENFNNITTVSEHPNFSGTKTNVSISNDSIILNSSELFDSASGLFDANTTRFFDSGVTNADFLASGNYEFANVIDIGAKHTVRVTASLTQSARNPDDLFDNRSGNFDDAKSNFDGDTPANCDAHLEIATSDDNSTYTSFQNFVIGTYTARYLKFRIVLTSTDLASTPVIQEVTVTVDMVDRIFSGNDISSGVQEQKQLHLLIHLKLHLMLLVLQWKMQTQEISLQFQIKLLIVLTFYLKIQVAQIFQELLILLQRAFKRSINKYVTSNRFYNRQSIFS